MSKINTDGNLAALSRYEAEQDEYDTLRDMFETEVKESVMEEIMGSDDLLNEYISELPESVKVLMAECVYKTQAGKKDAEYLDFGGQFIKHLTTGIEDSQYFADQVEIYVDNRIAGMT